MKSLRFTLATVIALASTNVWADLIRKSDKTPCTPTVHFKVPAYWGSAYIAMGDTVIEVPKADKERWTTIAFADLNIKDDSTFYFSSSKNVPCYTSYQCVTAKGANVSSYTPQKEGFTCESFNDKNNAEVWIQEHPDPAKTDQLYISYAKPSIKKFFVLPPQNEAWLQSNPLIYEDGKDHKLYPSDDACGWFYRIYIDEPLPKSAVIHRDDDEQLAYAIGMNGAWETNPSAPTPIVMDALYALYDSDSLYFVADDAISSALTDTGTRGWSSVRPNISGTCEFELATFIYDTDATLHGAFTCNPNWSMATEGTDLGKANVCFDSTAKYPITAGATDPVPCLGITTGMVESTLSIDSATGSKKMKLTEKGKMCFGAQADEAFKAMFTATKGINEKYIVSLPFMRNLNGMWEFNSDYYQSPGAPVPGGFYPAEEAPAASAMDSERLPAAESKRKAEGPTFFCPDYPGNSASKSPLGFRTVDEKEGFMKSDLICNGPGWNGGIDCEGLFLSGSELWNGAGMTDVGLQISEALGITWYETGWGWSCETFATPRGWIKYKEHTETPLNSTQGGSHRWMSTDGQPNDDSRILTGAGRNQHFCAEIHTKFRFKNGLKFSLSGDDDIWAFIDNKLAVDIGGMHLPAPGYVDVDKFMPNGIVGKVYDLDIYFCDRRTTMSNFSIKTNMFLGQKPLEVTPCCTDPIFEGKITYMFTTDSTGKDPTKTLISEADFEANPVQANGGIDVTNSSRPITNENKLAEVFPAGKYYLIVKIGSESRTIQLTIPSSTKISTKRIVASKAFRVNAVAPHEIEISLENNANATKQYAIMDMKGQVLSIGSLSSGNTRVKVPTSGSYIVKVGHECKRINMR